MAGFTLTFCLGTGSSDGRAEDQQAFAAVAATAAMAAAAVDLGVLICKCVWVCYVISPWMIIPCWNWFTSEVPNHPGCYVPIPHGPRAIAASGDSCCFVHLPWMAYLLTPWGWPAICPCVQESDVNILQEDKEQQFANRTFKTSKDWRCFVDVQLFFFLRQSPQSKGHFPVDKLYDGTRWTLLSRICHEVDAEVAFLQVWDFQDLTWCRSLTAFCQTKDASTLEVDVSYNFEALDFRIF